MFFDFEKLAHDLVEVNGNWYIVDTCKPWDTNRWETGLSKVDTEKLLADYFWDTDEDEEISEEEKIEAIKETAEEYAGWWDIEEHDNKRIAKKRHAEICKTAILQS